MELSVEDFWPGDEQYVHALCAASLVCRLWRPVAQSILVKRLYFVLNSKRDISRLDKLLERTQEGRIVGRPIDTTLDLLVWCGADDRLSKLLRALEGLRSIWLLGGDAKTLSLSWNDFAKHLPGSLFPAHRFSTPDC
jgi:hypothetical protein